MVSTWELVILFCIYTWLKTSRVRNRTKQKPFNASPFLKPMSVTAKEALDSSITPIFLSGLVSYTSMESHQPLLFLNLSSELPPKCFCTCYVLWYNTLSYYLHISDITTPSQVGFHQPTFLYLNFYYSYPYATCSSPCFIFLCTLIAI
jgi:hypothetical protein